MSKIDRVEITQLHVRGAESRPAAPRRRRRRQRGAHEGRQAAGEPLRDPDRDRRRPGRRVRHPLGRHARLARPDDHAGAAPDRPRPGDARADLRRPQARAARLRPHGPRAARHRPVGPRRQEVRRLGRGACSAASASACRPTPAPTTARRAAAASTARRRSPTSPSTARSSATAASRSTAGTTATPGARPQNLLGVRARVGDDMALMIDPACQLRTFMDALYVGRACDEAGYFWYEDPYRDAAVSAFGHKRLREKLKTPLLVSEHVRGLEQKGSFVVAGGCDMVHADPEYDMGITGAMKIAHLCEALGLDVQLHASGPAHRHCIAAIRNTHFYEQALVGPGHAELHAAGLHLRLQRLSRGRRRGRLLPGAGRPGPRRHLRLGPDRAQPHRAPRVRVADADHRSAPSSVGPGAARLSVAAARDAASGRRPDADLPELPARRLSGRCGGAGAGEVGASAGRDRPPRPGRGDGLAAGDRRCAGLARLSARHRRVRRSRRPEGRGDARAALPATRTCAASATS